MKKKKTRSKIPAYKKIKKVKKIRKINKLVKKLVKKQKKEKVKKEPAKVKSSDKMYFTQSTEDAIVEYNKETDQDKRNLIYNAQIKYPFEKLVENIFNTFKFSYFEIGPVDIQKETVAHLAANMHKFESGKGKAFSYFSIIAKNYLIALNNSTYKRFNQHVDIGEDHAEHTVQLQSEDKYHKEKEMSEFIRLMVEFWEKNVGKIFTKQRDLDIANAVIELFRSSDRIDAFNKKALYLYIREISECKTQQITKVINKMKQYQSNISKSYKNFGIVNVSSYIKA